MAKMKVLWFCNRSLTSFNNVTGTWLLALADNLVKSGEVELYNITSGKVRRTEKQIEDGLQQWIIPSTKHLIKGLPPKKIVIEIQKIVNIIKPDIIHIWGTENYWGLLTARGIIRGVVILEIQGLIAQVNRVFYGGLTAMEIIKCIGIKEIIKPSVSLIAIKHRLKRWKKYEVEIIKGHDVISTQSEWVRNHVKLLNPDAKIVNTKRSLRKAFLESKQWDYSRCSLHNIFTYGSDSSYKGLHFLFETIQLLKPSYPRVKLMIAGGVGKGIRQSGYYRYLIRLALRLKISENVTWLGSLSAEEIVKYQLESQVAVIPSFVESYCVALDEVLTVGLPCVVSYSGAMPELTLNGKNALLFPPGDAVSCANQIEIFFNNRTLSEGFSNNSYMQRKAFHSEDKTLNQLTIYYDLLNNEGIAAE